MYVQQQQQQQQRLKFLTGNDNSSIPEQAKIVVVLH
jgi:hypothetical protein